MWHKPFCNTVLLRCHGDADTGIRKSICVVSPDRGTLDLAQAYGAHPVELPCGLAGEFTNLEEIVAYGVQNMICRGSREFARAAHVMAYTIDQKVYWENKCRTTDTTTD